MKEEYCCFYGKFISQVTIAERMKCDGATDCCVVCGFFDRRDRFLMMNHEREERALEYFKKYLRVIVDAVTLPEGVECENFPVDMITELRGAVSYAHKMGDLNLESVRILTDELNRLYEEATK